MNNDMPPDLLEPWEMSPIPTADQMAEQVRRATLKQVQAQIAAAKVHQPKGSKHRPGATRQTIAKRSAASRKRARGARAARRKNR